MLWRRSRPINKNRPHRSEDQWLSSAIRQLFFEGCFIRMKEQIYSLTYFNYGGKTWVEINLDILGTTHVMSMEFRIHRAV